MKLSAALLVVATLVASCVGCGSPAWGTAQTVQPTTSSSITRALNATVILYDRSGELVCAGVRVSPTQIVTAHHCVVAATASSFEQALIEMLGMEDAIAELGSMTGRELDFATYAASIKAGEQEEPVRQRARVGALNSAHDVAILLTSPSGQESVPVRPLDELLRVGEGVFSVGHPYGLQYSYAAGSISTLCRWLSGPECWLQVDITIWGGSSGGGLFDVEGRLVGVASRRVGSGYAFFVPTEAIAKIVLRI
jgi:S1-C subfamily serine protease